LGLARGASYADGAKILLHRWRIRFTSRGLTTSRMIDRPILTCDLHVQLSDDSVSALTRYRPPRQSGCSGGETGAEPCAGSSAAAGGSGLLNKNPRISSQAWERKIPVADGLDTFRDGHAERLAHADDGPRWPGPRIVAGHAQRSGRS
jgi:hypothetical protein